MKEFSKIKILVAGEVCLDEYIQGEAKRLSPEAPIPVISGITKTVRLGMAGNVASNVKALGGQPTLTTVDGCLGESSDAICAHIEGIPLVMIPDVSRPTIKKTRIMAGSHPIVRLDSELTHPLDELVRSAFVRAILYDLPFVDGLIIQDYGKGIWSRKTLAEVIETACEMKKPVFVDPRRTDDASIYSGATIIKANEMEAEMMGGALALSQWTHNAVVTQGKDGMRGFNSRGTWDIPGHTVSAVDVTGAGDTVIAAMALAYLSGRNVIEACEFANAAAAVAVSKPGTATVALAEVEALLRKGEK